MALTVNSNIQAMNAYRNLSKTQDSLSMSLEKLSSGLRINRAADDSSGLAISEGLKAQIGGIQQASKNAQDGISVVQTADGALSQTEAILQRLRTLAVQSANDSQDTNSRAAITQEVNALTAEITHISANTAFNGQQLLDATYTGKKFQVGAASGDAITVDVVGSVAAGATTTYGTSGVNLASIASGAAASFSVGGVVVTTAALTASTNTTNIVSQLNADHNFSTAFTASQTSAGALVIKAKDNSLTGSITVAGSLTGTASSSAAATAANGGFNATDLLGNSGVLDVSSQTAANTAIATVDTAINIVSKARAALGAVQNRLQYSVNNLNTTAENLSASQSRITDTDMASEMVNFTRAQILSQAGTSMLSQAKNLPSSILDLLKS